MPVSPAHIARLAAGGGYCSGTLISPDEVLTCAHFFATRVSHVSQVRVSVAGAERRGGQVRFAPGTDIALVRLDSPVDAPFAFPSFTTRVRPLAPTVTFGFGGRAAHPHARAGRYLGSLPLAASRGLHTVVRPAGFTFNPTPVIKGDSGGPVLIDAKIAAVQSLILDPFRTNLRVATVSLLTPAVIAQLQR